MEHDWKKATLKPAVAAKNSDATNLTRHFKGGSPSLEGGMAPLNNLFGNNFFMNWQSKCYQYFNRNHLIFCRW